MLRTPLMGPPFSSQQVHSPSPLFIDRFGWFPLFGVVLKNTLCFALMHAFIFMLGG